jgi:GNAT superfamily N-acetyltransferase
MIDPTLETIAARYRGQMNPGQLDFDDRATRGQLALDIGWLIGHGLRLADELAEARETNARLQRRCQTAEAIASSKVVEAIARGRSFGRALANYAAATAIRERDEARAKAEKHRAECPMLMTDAEADAFLREAGFDMEKVQQQGDLAALAARLSVQVDTLTAEVERLTTCRSCGERYDRQGDRGPYCSECDA